MLLLEVIPGKSFGAFQLGMPISSAVAFIQSRNKNISHVELKFNEASPLSMDIFLDLIEDGIMLRFEPSTQKLKTIEIYEIPKVTLSYANSIFCSPEQAPTLVSIYERFGPTHPGEYDASSGVYWLHYPGVSFAFPIPKKYESLFSSIEDIPPMEFPDRTTPISSRILLYTGPNAMSPELAPTNSNCLYFEEISVQIGRGIFFSSRKCALDFHSSTQDVLTILGPPSRVFFKEEDKMKIHTTSYSGLSCADYFYNYFSLGIDILFDIDTHLVKKFILHTNFPSHQEFNLYVKCNFRIRIENPNQIQTKSENDSKKNSLHTSNISNLKETAHEKAIEAIHPDSKWSDIQRILGPTGKPVVQNRGSNTNPFGATLFYGYQGIIFEVMQNQHIASVCLFSNKQHQ